MTIAICGRAVATRARPVAADAFALTAGVTLTMTMTSTIKTVTAALFARPIAAGTFAGTTGIATALGMTGTTTDPAADACNRACANGSLPLATDAFAFAAGSASAILMATAIARTTLARFKPDFSARAIAGATGTTIAKVTDTSQIASVGRIAAANTFTNAARIARTRVIVVHVKRVRAGPVAAKYLRPVGNAAPVRIAG